MKFKRKPLVVEAKQWFGWDSISHRGFKEIKKLPFFKRITIGLSLGLHCESSFPPSKLGWIETLEGGHIVTPGDWIITGIAGEKFPCKPNIFERTYTIVEV